MEQNETKQNRYNNTKIYKIIHPETGYFYIGTTCDRLSKRLCYHKSKAKEYPNRSIYKCFNEISWENVKIILIDQISVNNREEQLRIENKYIETHIDDEKCLNSNFSFLGLSKEEYQHQYNKKYYQANKNEINKKNNDYRNNNIDRMKKYQKSFYEINRADILQKVKEYQEANKVKINCVCGGKYINRHKQQHEKTKIHKSYVDSGADDDIKKLSLEMK